MVVSYIYKYFHFLIIFIQISSSALYTFHAVLLVEGNVLHFKQAQSKNALYQTLDIFGNFCNIWMTSLEL